MAEQDPAPDEDLEELIALRARLDEAIREYSAKNLDRPGALTGWVLLVSHARYHDDGELSFSYDYSVGPDTNTLLGIGVVEVCRARMLADVGATRTGDDG